MSADHRFGDVSRQTWRAAVVLFLVVFLGGLGVTGASALWSQSGTVQTKITTGTWVDYSRPGWAWEPSLQATGRGGLLTDRIVLTWSAPPVDSPDIRYTVNLKDQVLILIPYDKTQETTSPTAEFSGLALLGADQYELTITAHVDGVPSDPVTWLISSTSNGTVVVEGPIP